MLFNWFLSSLQQQRTIKLEVAKYAGAGRIHIPSTNEPLRSQDAKEYTQPINIVP